MLISPRTYGIQGDEARGAENKATLSAKLHAYDAILNKQRYLAGDVNDLYSTTIERDT